MDSQKLKNIVEAAMLAAGNPLTIDQLRALFGEDNPPEKQDIRGVLQTLREEYEGRGIEIKEVASGFRVQVRDEMSAWLGKLWEERPPRYSRALMETLAIIAYRQPVTRGDVEDIRGVSVTTNIIRTLLERNWIKVVGHRDVPGKPAMFGTTREFLDYFNLKKLDDLPPLAELAKMEPVGLQLELGAPGIPVTEEDQNPATLDADAEAAIEDGADLADDEVNAANQPVIAETDGAAGQADAGETDAEDGLMAGASIADEAPLEAAGDTAVEHRIDADLDADIETVDVAPGAVAPLVGLNRPGAEPPEPASISSLDDARAAAAGSKDGEAGKNVTANEAPAEVVPIKKS